jgi:hypothetical protein
MSKYGELTAVSHTEPDKDKVVPLRSIEAHLGDRRYSSYCFLTSALEGVEWSASRPGRALPPGKEPPVPTVQEAGRAPEPVWTQRLEEKSSASVGDRTPSVQSVVRHYADMLCYLIQWNMWTVKTLRDRWYLPFCCWVTVTSFNCPVFSGYGLKNRMRWKMIVNRLSKNHEGSGRDLSEGTSSTFVWKDLEQIAHFIVWFNY